MSTGKTLLPILLAAAMFTQGCGRKVEVNVHRHESRGYVSTYDAPPVVHHERHEVRTTRQTHIRHGSAPAYPPAYAPHPQSGPHHDPAYAHSPPHPHAHPQPQPHPQPYPAAQPAPRPLRSVTAFVSFRVEVRNESREPAALAWFYFPADPGLPPMQDMLRAIPRGGRVNATIRLRQDALPGTLRIDFGGHIAEVWVDGRHRRLKVELDKDKLKLKRDD